MAERSYRFNTSECSVDNQDDGSDPPLTPHQQLLRDELHQVNRRLPLQRTPPPRLPPMEEGPSTSDPEAVPIVGTVLNEPMVHVDSMYTIDAFLGTGRFCTTYISTDRETRQSYACKRIKKLLPLAPFESEKLRREIKILHYLSGLPHIVRFFRAYEDPSFLYLFMELCTGGDLSMKMQNTGAFSEKRAVVVMREIIRAVHNCHSMGVVHRDLKPENVVLADESEDSYIRIIDFGLSCFIEKGRKLRHRAGTLEYAAPEVLQRSYGKEADVWSAGVILYQMLSGNYPFPVERRDELPRTILKGRLDLRRDPWPSISDSAKDLVKRMLDPNPMKRITTAEILRHAWVRDMGIPIPERMPCWFTFISRLRQIREMKYLARIGHMAMVEALSQDDLEQFKRIFTGMRNAQYGALTFNELWNKLYAIGSRVNEIELQGAIDPENDVTKGSADFMELLAAMVPSEHMKNEVFLQHVFRSRFADAGAWYISRRTMEYYAYRYQCELSKEAMDEAYREIGLGPEDTIGAIKFIEAMMNVDIGRSAATQVKKTIQCSIS